MIAWLQELLLELLFAVVLEIGVVVEIAAKLVMSSSAEGGLVS
jgi:hypothetical protein